MEDDETTIKNLTKDQLLKAYKEAISKLDNVDINYNEKIKHLIETWQFAHGLITMAGPELVPKILHWAVRHILHLMLLGEWKNVSMDSKKKLYFLVKSCIPDMASNTTPIAYRCKFILDVIYAPWGDPILKSLLFDPDSTKYSINDQIEFFTKERSCLISLRINKLCEDKCEDMALNLTKAYWRCYTHLLLKNPQHDLLEKTIQAEFQKKVIYDHYIALLAKYRKHDLFQEEMCKISLRYKMDLIKRIPKTQSATKELTKYFKKGTMMVATALVQEILMAPDPMNLNFTASQFVFTEDALQPTVEQDPALKIENENKFFVAALLEWVELNIQENENKFEKLLRKLMNATKHPKHLYLCSNLLQKKFENRFDTLTIELHVRGLTLDLNQFETKKIESSSEADILKAEYLLSYKYLTLYDLIKDNIHISRECVLTAFSLNPCQEIYDSVCEAAKICGALESTKGNNSAVNARLSRNSHLVEQNISCTDENVALETPELKQGILDLPDFLQSDILTILLSPRMKQLSWHLEWNELDVELVKLLKLPEKLNLIRKQLVSNDDLKYLDLDYTLFEHLPETEYPGIEKGYEMFADTDDSDESYQPGVTKAKAKSRKNIEELEIEADMKHDIVVADEGSIIKMMDSIDAVVNGSESIDIEELYVKLTKPPEITEPDLEPKIKKRRLQIRKKRECKPKKINATFESMNDIIALVSALNSDTEPEVEGMPDVVLDEKLFSHYTTASDGKSIPVTFENYDEAINLVSLAEYETEFESIVASVVAELYPNTRIRKENSSKTKTKRRRSDPTMDLMDTDSALDNVKKNKPQKKSNQSSEAKLDPDNSETSILKKNPQNQRKSGQSRAELFANGVKSKITRRNSDMYTGRILIEVPLTIAEVKKRRYSESDVGATELRPITDRLRLSPNKQNIESNELKGKPRPKRRFNDIVSCRPRKLAEEKLINEFERDTLTKVRKHLFRIQKENEFGKPKKPSKLTIASDEILEQTHRVLYPLQNDTNPSHFKNYLEMSQTNSTSSALDILASVASVAREPTTQNTQYQPNISDSKPEMMELFVREQSASIIAREMDVYDAVALKQKFYVTMQHLRDNPLPDVRKKCFTLNSRGRAIEDWVKYIYECQSVVREQPLAKKLRFKDIDETKKYCLLPKLFIKPFKLFGDYLRQNLIPPPKQSGKRTKQAYPKKRVTDATASDMVTNERTEAIGVKIEETVEKKLKNSAKKPKKSRPSAETLEQALNLSQTNDSALSSSVEGTVSLSSTSLLPVKTHQAPPIGPQSMPSNHISETKTSATELGARNTSVKRPKKTKVSAANPVLNLPCSNGFDIPSLVDSSSIISPSTDKIHPAIGPDNIETNDDTKATKVKDEKKPAVKRPRKPKPHLQNVTSSLFSLDGSNQNTSSIDFMNSSNLDNSLSNLLTKEKKANTTGEKKPAVKRPIKPKQPTNYFPTLAYLCMQKMDLMYPARVQTAAHSKSAGKSKKSPVKDEKIKKPVVRKPKKQSNHEEMLSTNQSLVNGDLARTVTSGVSVPSVSSTLILPGGSSIIDSLISAALNIPIVPTPTCLDAGTKTKPKSEKKPPKEKSTEKKPQKPRNTEKKPRAKPQKKKSTDNNASIPPPELALSSVKGNLIGPAAYLTNIIGQPPPSPLTGNQSTNILDFCSLTITQSNHSSLVNALVGNANSGAMAQSPLNVKKSVSYTEIILPNKFPLNLQSSFIDFESCLESIIPASVITNDKSNKNIKPEQIDTSPPVAPPLIVSPPPPLQKKKPIRKPRKSKPKPACVQQANIDIKNVGSTNELPLVIAKNFNLLNPMLASQFNLTDFESSLESVIPISVIPVSNFDNSGSVSAITSSLQNGMNCFSNSNYHSIRETTPTASSSNTGNDFFKLLTESTSSPPLKTQISIQTNILLQQSPVLTLLSLVPKDSSTISDHPPNSPSTEVVNNSVNKSDTSEQFVVMPKAEDILLDAIKDGATPVSGPNRIEEAAELNDDDEIIELIDVSESDSDDCEIVKTIRVCKNTRITLHKNPIEFDPLETPREFETKKSNSKNGKEGDKQIIKTNECVEPHVNNGEDGAVYHQKKESNSSVTNETSQIVPDLEEPSKIPKVIRTYSNRRRKQENNIPLPISEQLDLSIIKKEINPDEFKNKDFVFLIPSLQSSQAEGSNSETDPVQRPLDQQTTEHNSNDQICQEQHEEIILAVNDQMVNLSTMNVSSDDESENEDNKAFANPEVLRPDVKVSSNISRHRRHTSLGSSNTENNTSSILVRHDYIKNGNSDNAKPSTNNSRNVLNINMLYRIDEYGQPNSNVKFPLNITTDRIGATRQDLENLIKKSSITEKNQLHRIPNRRQTLPLCSSDFYVSKEPKTEKDVVSNPFEKDKDANVIITQLAILPDKLEKKIELQRRGRSARIREKTVLLPSKKQKPLQHKAVVKNESLKSNKPKSSTPEKRFSRRVRQQGLPAIDKSKNNVANHVKKNVVINIIRNRLREDSPMNNKMPMNKEKNHLLRDHNHQQRLESDEEGNVDEKQHKNNEQKSNRTRSSTAATNKLTKNSTNFFLNCIVNIDYSSIFRKYSYSEENPRNFGINCNKNLKFFDRQNLKKLSTNDCDKKIDNCDKLLFDRNSNDPKNILKNVPGMLNFEFFELPQSQQVIEIVEVTKTTNSKRDDSGSDRTMTNEIANETNSAELSQAQNSSSKSSNPTSISAHIQRIGFPSTVTPLTSEPSAPKICNGTAVNPQSVIKSHSSTSVDPVQPPFVNMQSSVNKLPSNVQIINKFVSDSKSKKINEKAESGPLINILSQQILVPASTNTLSPICTTRIKEPTPSATGNFNSKHQQNPVVRVSNGENTVINLSSTNAISGQQLLEILNNSIMQQQLKAQSMSTSVKAFSTQNTSITATTSTVTASNSPNVVQFLCKSDGRMIQLTPIGPVKTNNCTTTTTNFENLELMSTTANVKHSQAYHQPQIIVTRKEFHQQYGESSKLVGTTTSTNTNHSLSEKDMCLAKSSIDALPKFNQVFGSGSKYESYQTNTTSENGKLPTTVITNNITKIITTPSIGKRNITVKTEGQSNEGKNIRIINYDTASRTINDSNLNSNVNVTTPMTIYTPNQTSLSNVIGNIKLLRTKAPPLHHQKQQSIQIDKTSSIANSPLRVTMPIIQPHQHSKSGTMQSRLPIIQNVIRACAEHKQQHQTLLIATPRYVSGGSSATSGIRFENFIPSNSAHQQFIQIPVTQAQVMSSNKLSQNPTPNNNVDKSTLEQLREFDLVLEQVKERSCGSTEPPSVTSSPEQSTNTSVVRVVQTDKSVKFQTKDIPQKAHSKQETIFASTPQVLQKINLAILQNPSQLQKFTQNRTLEGGSQPFIVVSNYSGGATTNLTYTPQTVQMNLSPTTIANLVKNASKTIVNTEEAPPGTANDTSMHSGLKIPSSASLSKIPAHMTPLTITTTTQSLVAAPKPIPKPLEDEQTVQRIYDILAGYAEQLRNSPDLNNKPAPRRRTNPPTNPAQPSTAGGGVLKRKKSSYGNNCGGSMSSFSSELSPNDTERQMLESEESSCDVSNGGTVYSRDDPDVAIIEDNEEPKPLQISASTSNLITSLRSPFTQQLFLTDSSQTQMSTATGNSDNPPITRNYLIASHQSTSGGHLMQTSNGNAVLVPRNYLVPINLVKNGQITILSSPKGSTFNTSVQTTMSDQKHYAQLNNTNKIINITQQQLLQSVTKPSSVDGMGGKSIAGKTFILQSYLNQQQQLDKDKYTRTPPSPTATTMSRNNSSLIIQTIKKAQSQNSLADPTPQPIKIVTSSTAESGYKQVVDLPIKSFSHIPINDTLVQPNNPETESGALRSESILMLSNNQQETIETQDQIESSINISDVKEEIEIFYENDHHSEVISNYNQDLENSGYVINMKADEEDHNDNAEHITINRKVDDYKTTEEDEEEEEEMENSSNKNFLQHHSTNILSNYLTSHSLHRNPNSGCITYNPKKLILNENRKIGFYDSQSKKNLHKHKQSAAEREFLLQKSLSEECEDLGVDEPSTSDLFPEADLLFDPNSPTCGGPNSAHLDQSSQESLNENSEKKLKSISVNSYLRHYSQSEESISAVQQLTSTTTRFPVKFMNKIRDLNRENELMATENPETHTYKTGIDELNAPTISKECDETLGEDYLRNRSIDDLTFATTFTLSTENILNDSTEDENDSVFTNEGIGEVSKNIKEVELKLQNDRKFKKFLQRSKSLATQQPQQNTVLMKQATVSVSDDIYSRKRLHSSHHSIVEDEASSSLLTVKKIFLSESKIVTDTNSFETSSLDKTSTLLTTHVSNNVLTTPKILKIVKRTKRK